MELSVKAAELIVENCRALASGLLGSRAWWRKVDLLSNRKENNHCSSLHQEFVRGLNDYFGDLCLDQKLHRPDSGRNV